MAEESVCGMDQLIWTTSLKLLEISRLTVWIEGLGKEEWGATTGVQNWYIRIEVKKVTCKNVDFNIPTPDPRDTIVVSDRQLNGQWLLCLFASFFS